MNIRSIVTALAVVAWSPWIDPARAQCAAEWARRFPYQELPFEARATAVFDDGSGPALFLGGVDDEFEDPWLVKWDGTTFTAPPQPFQNSPFDPPPSVTALETFDDGSGVALYVAGEIRSIGGTTVNSVARWDGSAWQPLGAGVMVASNTYPALVFDLEPFDDGSGPALFVAGEFAVAGGQPASQVARWDGTSWSNLSGGLQGGFATEALAVFDDGSGPALYAGGSFTAAGATPLSNVARWDGTSWTDVGGGMDSVVSALAVYDDGSGPALYAGGYFSTAGGVPASRIARWNGTSWSAVGTGITGSNVRSLAVFDGGSGPELYVAGDFSHAGGIATPRLAVWDAAWAAGPGTPDGAVHTLAVHDDGSGPSIFVAGAFDQVAGVQSPRVASFDGASWSRIATLEGPDGTVHALEAFGGELVAGGEFTRAGTAEVQRLAAWDGASWHDLGGGVEIAPGSGEPRVNDLLVHDDGSGPSLFVAGYFERAGGNVQVNGVGRWDGSQWHALGAGMDGVNGVFDVAALCVYDDGGGEQLYAAGDFTMAGGQPASWIARWNGTSWSALGPETFSGPGGVNHGIRALLVHDDGSGSKLWVGGGFFGVGGIAGTSNLVRWDGSTWEPAGNPIGLVQTLAELRPFPFDGSRPRLLVGGNFTQIGGAPGSFLASWDGATWTPQGANGRVQHLAVFNDGASPGDSLFAYGFFTMLGGQPISNAARWDGTSWSQVDPVVLANDTAELDTGGAGGPALFAGGPLVSLQDGPPRAVAEFANPCPVFTYYCTGKTGSTGCVPFVLADGTPSVSSTAPFRIEAHQVPVDSVGVVLYGAKKSNLAFHGGKLCIKAPITRLPHKSAKQTGPPPCEGVIARNFNARIQSGLDPSLTVGATVFAQCRGRDAGDPFGDLLTSAVRFVISP